MARHGPVMKFTSAFAAASMLVMSSAAAAAPRSVDPLVSLSVFGTQESRSAVCAAGSAAAAAAGTAAAAQAGAAPGCVLPAVDAPPPVAVESAPPPVAVVEPVAATSGGIGVLPLLLGLAAIAAAVALLGKGSGSDDNGEIIVPVSP